MANIPIQVIITARDTATATIAKVGNTLSGVGNRIGASLGFLTTTAGTLGLALGAAGLTAAMRSSLDASIRLENALLGLKSVAAALGQDVDSATQAAKSLAEDGLMGINEAAEGLKNLLSTGFSLPEAINLMTAFKDAAAFNRQGTLAFGQAIVGATQGIKNQNSIMVDNVGITKNLSVIMKEAGLSVDAMMQVTTDASVRQKLYNGLIKEASIFQGDAARMAETFGGSMAVLGTKTFYLRAAIGQALQPAISILTDSLGTTLVRATEWVTAHLVELQVAFITIAATVQTMANIISGAARLIVGAIMSIKTLSLEPLKNAVKDSFGAQVITIRSAQNKIVDIAKQQGNEQVKAAQKASDKIVDINKDKREKIAEELKREEEDFKESVMKREKRFNEQLADLIWGHQDKGKKLKEDLTEENADFAEKMSEREDKHKETIEEIKAQIDEEVAKGEEADEKTLKSLRKRLAAEEKDFTKSTDKLKAEHDKRVANFEAQIKVEEEILKRHEGDVAAIKDKAKEDDITRLKRQYEEEKAEAEKEHRRKVADIQKKGKELGETMGNNINQAVGASGAQLTSIMSKMGTESGNKFKEGISTSAREAGERFIGDFIGGIRGKIEDIGRRVFRMREPRKEEWLFGLFGPLGTIASKFFQTGGIVPGASSQAVPAVLHGGERVIPSYLAGEQRRTAGGGGQVAINLYVGTYVGTQTELREFGRKLWEEIGNLARAQHKTPTELLDLSPI